MAAGFGATEREALPFPLGDRDRDRDPFLTPKNETRNAKKHTNQMVLSRTCIRLAYVYKKRTPHLHDLAGDALGLDEHRVLHLRAVGLEERIVAGPPLGPLGQPSDDHLLRLGSQQEVEVSAPTRRPHGHRHGQAQGHGHNRTTGVTFFALRHTHARRWLNVFVIWVGVGFVGLRMYCIMTEGTADTYAETTVIRGTADTCAEKTITLWDKETHTNTHVVRTSTQSQRRE